MAAGCSISGVGLNSRIVHGVGGQNKHTVIVRMFDSKDVSVPQNRPRLWFFAVLSTFLALLGVTPEDLEFAYKKFLNMFLQDHKPHKLDDYLLPEHDPAIVARHEYHLAAWKKRQAQQYLTNTASKKQSKWKDHHIAEFEAHHQDWHAAPQVGG